jgi:hypothetical protein
MSTSQHSPAPWSYAYSPWTVRSEYDARGVGTEIRAYEVFDAEGDKVLDTNENSPAALQEANACLATAAPRLLASLITCANLLADYDESDGEEGQAYREAVAAIAEATGHMMPGTPKPIVIEVRGGVVQDVLNVPPGIEYEIRDYDNLEEPS